MNIDDLKDFLVKSGSRMSPLLSFSTSRLMLNVDNLNAYITALSTALVPLTTIVEGQCYLRNFIEPQYPVSLFLDEHDEEIEPLTMGLAQVTWRVDAYWFVQRSAVESVARDQTKAYMQALINCVETHPDYMTFEDRAYYDGVEGKQDIKASKATLVFKWDE